MVFSASGRPKFELLPGILSVIYSKRCFNDTGEIFGVFLGPKLVILIDERTGGREK